MARVTAWRIDRRAQVVAQVPADVVHLDTEQMPQSVRIKRRGDTCIDQGIGTTLCNTHICE